MKNLTNPRKGPANWLKGILIGCAAIAFVASCMQQSAKTPPTITSSNRPDVADFKLSTSKFDKFSHAVEEHKAFECATCHQRDTAKGRLEFAGHESCVGCHLNQFLDNTVTAENQAMCAICHENVGSSNPPMKAFPAKFREGFNMKFEHAAHDSGAGLPPQGCAFCHSPAGAAQTIPSGIDSHNNCYTCHTPESKIGSCSVCHELAPYSRTLPSQYNFKAIFRHSDHTARQGVSCNECHRIIPGANQRGQVTNIQILEHKTTPGNNCLKCHNGRDAFDGNSSSNPASCRRCHTSDISPVLPVGTFGAEKEPEGTTTAPVKTAPVKTPAPVPAPTK